MARFEKVSINELTVNTVKDESTGFDLTGNIDPRDKMVVFEDFVVGAAATLEANGWNNLSTGDADDATVAPGTQGGVLEIDTSTTDNQGVLFCSSVGLKANFGGVAMEARVKPLTDIANMMICVGFSDSAVLQEPASLSGTTYTTTVADGALFLYDTDATTDTWRAVCVDTNVDDTADTGVVPVADTYQTLRVELNASGLVAKFYINGNLVATQSTAGVTETVALYPVIAVYNRSAATNAVEVDYIGYECDRA